jgi:predicted enzyme related to lactoylglutathione lyase
MGQPVVHFQITARDAARLEQFYSRMFDWNVESDSPFRYRRRVDTGAGTGIHGDIAQTDGTWPNTTICYVEVDDVRAYLDRAETLGGSTLLPPTETEDDATIAIFRDPEGVAVGLVQR